MAETVYLKDGSTVYIFDDPKEALAKLIHEKLGLDAVRFFNDFVNEIEDELKYTTEAKDEYEKIADGYLTLLRDSADIFDSIHRLTEAPRASRSAIKALAEDGYKAILDVT